MEKYRYWRIITWKWENDYYVEVNAMRDKKFIIISYYSWKSLKYEKDIKLYWYVIIWVYVRETLGNHFFRD